MASARKFALGTLVGAGGIIAFTVVGWRTSDLGRAAADLEHQRAAARREGVPIEYDDLRRLNPAVSDDENAASLYAQGFADLVAEGNLKGVDADRTIDALAAGTAKPEEIAKVRASLTPFSPALGLIRRGSQRKGCDFHRHWERGSALTFSEYGFARTVGRALVLRALLTKDPHAAVDDLRTAARLRAHLGSEPFVIPSLAGAAMEAVVQKGVRALARRGEAWAMAMPAVLDDLGPLPDLHRTLAGESVFARKVVDEIARLGPSILAIDGQVSSPALRLAGLKSVREAFEARTIEHWRGVWAAIPPDPLDWRAALKATTGPPIPSSPSYALVEFTSPIFSGIGPLAAKLEAERRLTRAALDLWSGRPPVLAKDPFGAGPLRMRGADKTWTLWSLGPDAVDQGGKPRTKRSSDTRYDLVVDSTGR